MTRLRDNWLIITILAGVIAVYLVCVAPSLTWVGLDNDAFSLYYSAKYLEVFRQPGYPTYTILSYLIYRVPVGTEGFRLALFGSTLPAIGTVALVYFITKKLTTNKYAPYVACLSLAGAGLFLMQATIPEIYTFSAFMITATWASYLYNKPILTAVLAGLTFGTHPLVFPAAGLLAYRGAKQYWYIPTSIVAGLYGYVAYAGFVVGQSPASSIFSDIGTSLTQGMIRLRDFGMLMITGFGLAVIPMVLWLKNQKRSWLLWVMASAPIIYFLITKYPTSEVHLVLALPVLAVAAGLGLSQFKVSPKIVLACSGILLCLLPLKYDIGRTLDPSVSATQYTESLSEIPSNSIIINYVKAEGYNTAGFDDRTMLPVFLYNHDTGSNLVYVSLQHYLTEPDYRASLGIDTPMLNINIFDSRGFDAYAEAIAKRNPGRPTYYHVAPSNSPYSRELELVE